MNFHILGHLAVLRAGQHVDLGRPKQRAVLALLLLSANRVLPVDRLIELLWENAVPDQAVGALQAYISNLRRALEPARLARTPAEVLVTRPPGYLLRVGPDDLDAARFERLAHRGRELLAAGRPEPARVVLDGALALWQGPALAEFATQRFARAEAARLEELRSGAAEDRLQACLDAGGHAAAVAGLEAAVRDEPLRERRWELLILALYRSGRQAEALRAYARAQRHLVEELGVDPSARLRALECQVLQQSPAIDWHPPALERAALSLPPPARLVGRGRELNVLESALDTVRRGSARLVAVSGEPGIGKTRLAEELAAIAAAQGATVLRGRACETDGVPPLWPWAQVVHDLGGRAAPGAPDAPDAPDALLARTFPDYEAVAELLHKAAAHRPLVLILDDLHWADRLSHDLLAHLAARVATAPILVVAASRGARADAYGPWAARRALERVRLRGLSPCEVSRLAVQATGREPTPEQVTALHDRTDGNPFFVAELAELLAAEGALAPGAVPDGVRDVVRHRVSRLPAGTATLLTLAAAQGRHFELRAVAAAERILLDDALDRIDAAVAAGLVVEDGAAAGCYRFTPTLVRDALLAELGALRLAQLRRRLTEEPDGPALRVRHLRRTPAEPAAAVP